MSSSHDTVPTADSKEVAFFNSISDLWWGSKNLLHYFNSLRVPLVRDGLIDTGLVKKKFVNSSKPLEGLRILDVGCGGGILTEDLAALGCAVVGIDLGSDSINIAKSHATLNPSLTNISYFCESVEDHAKHNPEKYDAIVASEVIEHVNEPELFLEHCTKCLKPGGSIFITTFNKTWSSWLLGIIFAEYIWGFIPRGTHTWDKFFDPKDIEVMLEKFNCRTRSVRGVIYNCFTKTWHWWWSSSITYTLQGVKRHE
ncbi:hypothetical protein ILUMI_00623 [Ignelater luminosus]|uniref:Ubiquinone biosynthesis O-methyltransferase, mitochondrial n=1 Tax=Ignelater luminosus TaxID=2038154 RepID=A0A8K0DLI9_IGNLU|nr:hypothetical protein ILUMI_00623 [Ignelater luminosus]